jgi:putative membrane-bound dehydrogenase-like protein
MSARPNPALSAAELDSLEEALFARYCEMLRAAEAVRALARRPCPPPAYRSALFKIGYAALLVLGVLLGAQLRRAFGPTSTPPADASAGEFSRPLVYHPSIREARPSDRTNLSGDRMRRSLSGPLLFLALTAPAAGADPAPKADPGMLPVGADGKPLNLDFETGTLKDWIVEGEAFKGQPIKGDTVAPRRGDMKSEHQGTYWIGGYEKAGDKPTGTLTSKSFKVTHPWASFLVGGGPHPLETCVELVEKEGGKVFFRAAGLEEENLRRVAVDLKDVQGKEILVRLVDQHTGHWGHLNFDDFRFHTAKPAIALRPKGAGPLDVYKYAGQTPADAAKNMTVPEGFEVKLFAGEPDVKQPIAFCIDDRGRLWVAEAFSYPQRQPEGKGKDRILIFEDTDGDGKFDKRTVFMEGLNLVSGLEVGFGGVWIGAAPYLMFVPVKDDKPVGEPKILLDGWAYQDTHETLNTFTWGPDGWLYGCHGVFTHSRVGKPGTPDKDRTPINAGVWRYHPTRHVFEVFAHGTSNPWGLDFNEYGHAFVEACVIPHNWYIIPGGRYQRQAGAHFNPYTYIDIPTIAEHRHYVGANPHGGNGRSDEVGGGHAHSGAMIYQGGSWPKEYHGKMFMGNIHGHRINVDTLTPKGSGYVATRSPDFLLSHDKWTMFVNLQSGPDGNVYVIDWYDKQSCHTGDPQIWDRSNGRIFKICYKSAKPVTGLDLQKCSDDELLKYHSSDNEWYVRHARRILQERYGDPAKKIDPEVLERVAKKLEDIEVVHLSDVYQLRGLLTLHCINALTKARLAKAMKGSEQFRAWSLRLAFESKDFRGEELLNLCKSLGKNSPVIRLAIASGLQRLSSRDRCDFESLLLTHGEDAKDYNLPALYWYAFEPLAEVYPKVAISLAMDAKIPQFRDLMVRRLAAAGTEAALEQAVGPLDSDDHAQFWPDVLRNINEGLRGRRSAPMPKSWPGIYAKLSKSANPEIRAQATALAITFGDTNAFAGLRKVLTNAKADVAARQSALTALAGAKDKELPPVLHKLLGELALRASALKALAAYDDPKTPAAILAVYGSLNSEEKRDALNTLAARASYARELLSAVEKKTVPAADVSADVVRAMMNLDDPALEKQIGTVWGVARRTPEEKVKLIAVTKASLLARPLATADRMLGRAVFQKTCAQCHTLYGVGSKIGPDITGSNRPNLDYLLENILDPSAVIPKDYAVTVFEMDNGRKITGIVKQETDAVVTVQTANELLTLPKKEIDSRKSSDVSMMPDDILKTVKPDEFRALIAYLQHPQQVPMLATLDNAKDLFNGKDLSGWDGDPKLWKVENGEIVGTSPGIKHNEFLKSHLAAGDFKLTVKVKLTPDRENSGIQFRSEALPGTEMKGYQADVGQGWWGKLYEENGRALLWDKSGEAHVKKGDWNEYVVVAKGSKIQTFINGQPCVDLDDPNGARRGIFALQIHAGGAMEVRFKDFKLELDPK